MTLGLLDHPPAPLPVPDVVPVSLGEHLAAATESLAGAGAWPVELADDAALADAVAALARIESRAVSLRLALAGEAESRRLAEQTAETGTDAWLARLTGTTRAQAAGGLRLARLLAEKYAATREAFAAGRLRVDQVRVILICDIWSPFLSEADREIVTRVMTAMDAFNGTRPSGDL